MPLPLLSLQGMAHHNDTLILWVHLLVRVPMPYG